MALLKKIIKTFLALSLGIAIAWCVFYATHTSLNRLPSVEEVNEFDNISAAIPLEERNAI